MGKKQHTLLSILICLYNFFIPVVFVVVILRGVSDNVNVVVAEVAVEVAVVVVVFVIVIVVDI